MERKIIKTDKAPAAIGPYSQGIVAGNMVFTSGQIPMDPATGEIVQGGIAEQAAKTMDNLKAVVEAGGAAMGDVVKCLCFLSDMDDFAGFNEVYAKYFPEGKAPGRSCVAVKTLPRNVLVEVEAIVVKG